MACHSRKRPRSSLTGDRLRFPIPNTPLVNHAFTSSENRVAEICSSYATRNVVRKRVSLARGERIAGNENRMKKASRPKRKRSEVPDIDFTGGIRGKYAARYAEGTNLVALSPDVAAVFPDSAAVNEALRTLVRISGKTVRAARSSRKNAR